MEKEESEVERAGRAPPSTPPAECCSVSVAAGDQWRDEDTSRLSGQLHPCGSLNHHRMEEACFLNILFSPICFSKEANKFFQNNDPHPLERSNALHQSGRPLGLAWVSAGYTSKIHPLLTGFQRWFTLSLVLLANCYL